MGYDNRTRRRDYYVAARIQDSVAVYSEVSVGIPSFGHDLSIAEQGVGGV
jgi:hypothetical protein